VCVCVCVCVCVRVCAPSGDRVKPSVWCSEPTRATGCVFPVVHLFGSGSRAQCGQPARIGDRCVCVCVCACRERERGTVCVCLYSIATVHVPYQRVCVCVCQPGTAHSPDAHALAPGMLKRKGAAGTAGRGRGESKGSTREGG